MAKKKRETISIELDKLELMDKLSYMVNDRWNDNDLLWDFLDKEVTKSFKRILKAGGLDDIFQKLFKNQEFIEDVVSDALYEDKEMRALIKQFAKEYVKKNKGAK